VARSSIKAFNVKNILAVITKNKTLAMCGSAVLVLLTLAALKRIGQFSPRVLALFDPETFKDVTPLVSSVAEHGGTKWQSIFMFTGNILLVCPLGVYLAMVRNDPTNYIVILNYIALSFFTARMNRLKLLLAPAISLLGGFTLSEMSLLASNKLNFSLRGFTLPSLYLPAQLQPMFKVKNPTKTKSSNILEILVIIILSHLIFHYISIDISHFNYNGLSTYIRTKNGGTTNDDVKNSYEWLNSNSPTHSRVLSWWDYGYQISGFSNRTVIVDNFTVNNFRIAIVGLIMSGNEDIAIKMLRLLKVNYVLVFAPGTAQHHMGTDISKMYWMMRISQNQFPHIIDESLYGHLDIYEKATPGMVNSVMYKACFYEIEKTPNELTGQMGVNPDSGRQVLTALNGEGVKLKYLEEAYSSSHRTIRIFKVKEQSPFWTNKFDVSI